MAVAEVRARRLQPDVRSEQLRVLIANPIRHPIQVLPVRHGDRLAEPQEVLLRGADLPDGPVLDLREVQAGRQRPAVPGRHDDVDPLGPLVQILVHLDHLDPRVPQEPQASQVAFRLFDQLAVEWLAGLEEQFPADDVIARADVNAVGDAVECEQAAAALVEDLLTDDLDDADDRRRRVGRLRLRPYRLGRHDQQDRPQPGDERNAQSHRPILRRTNLAEFFVLQPEPGGQLGLAIVVQHAVGDVLAEHAHAGPNPASHQPGQELREPDFRMRVGKQKRQKTLDSRSSLPNSRGPGFRYLAPEGPTRSFRTTRAYSGSVGSRPSRGAPVPDEPMNSLRPSRKVRSRPLPLFDPSLAW